MSKRNRAKRRGKKSESSVRIEYFESGNVKDLLKPILFDTHNILVVHGIDHCHGVEICHKDGTTSCSLGADCHGSETVHTDGQSCGLTTVCEWCGPR
jgi:hypothetical protein